MRNVSYGRLRRYEKCMDFDRMGLQKLLWKIKSALTLSTSFFRGFKKSTRSWNKRRYDTMHNFKLLYVRLTPLTNFDNSGNRVFASPTLPLICFVCIIWHLSRWPQTLTDDLDDASNELMLQDDDTVRQSSYVFAQLPSALWEGFGRYGLPLQSCGRHVGQLYDTQLFRL